MSRPHFTVHIASVMALLIAMPTQAAIHLSFGLYTSNKPTTMVKQFRPVLDLLEARTSEQLGTQVEIRIQVAKDYEQGIAHLASGKVDFSRFGPASYIEAKRANSGLRILAMERVRGDKVFYGIIAVGRDSPITSVGQLRGSSFAFGNDQSTIGRYLSQLFLRNHGILSSDLSRFEYLGRHDTVGTAVGAGHFDAGALNEATFSKLVAKGVAIRELARFPNVTKPWIAREGLPERLFMALRHALLVIEDPIVIKLLKADGFVPGEDSDFADIRAAIEMNDKFFLAPAAPVDLATASPGDGADEAAPGQVMPSPGGGATPDEGRTSAGEPVLADPAGRGMLAAPRASPEPATSADPGETVTAGDVPVEPPAPGADGGSVSRVVSAGATATGADEASAAVDAPSSARPGSDSAPGPDLLGGTPEVANGPTSRAASTAAAPATPVADTPVGEDPSPSRTDSAPVAGTPAPDGVSPSDVVSAPAPPSAPVASTPEADDRPASREAATPASAADSGDDARPAMNGPARGQVTAPPALPGSTDRVPIGDIGVGTASPDADATTSTDAPVRSPAQPASDASDEGVRPRPEHSAAITTHRTPGRLP